MLCLWCRERRANAGGRSFSTVLKCMCRYWSWTFLVYDEKAVTRAREGAKQAVTGMSGSRFGGKVPVLSRVMKRLMFLCSDLTNRMLTRRNQKRVDEERRRDGTAGQREISQSQEHGSTGPLSLFRIIGSPTFTHRNVAYAHLQGLSCCVDPAVNKTFSWKLGASWLEERHVSPCVCNRAAPVSLQLSCICSWR